MSLKEWIFEIDDTQGESIARTLLSVHDDYLTARRKMKQTMEYVRQRQRETMAVVERTLELAPQTKKLSPNERHQIGFLSC